MYKVKAGATGILNICNLILLGRRVDNDEAYPGLWCTPGGGLEEGETIEQCLQREFREEVGLDVSSFGMFTTVWERHDPVKGGLFMVFKQVYKIKPKDPIVGDGFSDVKFFSWDEISNMVKDKQITPGTSSALMDFYAYSK